MKYFVPKKTALIIQDLQNDVISEGGAWASSGAPAHAKKQNIVENVKTLAKTARSVNLPVIHIHYIVEEGACGLKQNAPLFRDVKGSNALVRGSWGAAPVNGLEPKKGDYVIEKMRMNGFYNTNLDNLLRGLGIEVIIITGAWTNMSIEHTARHGADLGYEVIVASDGTSTINDEWQNTGLNYALTNVATIGICSDIANAMKRGQGIQLPGIDAKSSAIYNLVGGLEKIATGFIFTEGPIWNKVGKYLLFSDMPGDMRRKWSAKDGIIEVMKPSNKCNGMTYDSNGNLIICEHVTSSVIREFPDGKKRETIASHYKGKELNSPNDVIVSNDGSIYFTDPPFGRVPVFGLERDRELDFQGVYRIPPEGGEVELLVEDFDTPNGLCFSPDGKLLYINDSTRALVKVFNVKPDGSIANGRIFFDNIGHGTVGEGFPDGMKCDELGNIYVSGPGGIWVINPSGKHLGIIRIPEVVGNLTWGEEDWKTLYIAATTSIYRVSMKVAGARSSYMK
ncbi:MAG: isochorismatase family protein [Atribacterota bacterium]|nr:isochorismatase family protein [Atribacterota bacterium]